ncbi:MAG: hypothetical protein J6S67_00720 [Methanobrevibacter sp.]|nr:hypothetical protein [Methanobrevibacter sp.]
MAIDIDFDDLGNDDDDTTTMKDLFEKLKDIAKNTDITAQQAQKELNTTQTDKKIQEEEDQKAKLNADKNFEDVGEGADTVLFPDMDQHTKKIVEAIQNLQDALVQKGIDTGQPLKKTKKQADENDEVQEIEAKPKRGKKKEGEIVEEDDETEKPKETKYDKEGYALDKKGKRIQKVKGKEWDKKYEKYGLKESDFYKTREDIEKENDEEAKRTANEVWKHKNQQNENTKDRQGLNNLKSFHENEGTRQARNQLNNAYGKISSLRDRIGANMSEEEKANSTSYGLLGGLLGGIEKYAQPLMDIGAVVGIAGQLTKWVRAINQDTFTEGINGFQALGQTVQDGIYTVGNKLGFTANSGKDLRDYRQNALSNNLMLYTKAGTTDFDTDKWLTSKGINPIQNQAVNTWVTQMSAMGKSTLQIQSEFDELSKDSAKLGVSFKNLSQSVAKNSQYSEAMGGTTKGILKGTESMDRLLNKWGLKDSAINDLVSSKTAGVMESILVNHGLGQLAESANGNPQALYQMLLQYNLGDEFLEKTIGMASQGDMQEFKGNSAMAKEERTYALSTTLESEYGITSNDWQTSARTAESIETGASKIPTTPSLTNSKSELHITLGKGLQATLMESNGITRGQFSTAGSGLYVQSRNLWLEKDESN